MRFGWREEDLKGVPGVKVQTGVFFAARRYDAKVCERDTVFLFMSLFSRLSFEFLDCKQSRNLDLDIQ